MTPDNDRSPGPSPGPPRWPRSDRAGVLAQVGRDLFTGTSARSGLPDRRREHLDRRRARDRGGAAAQRASRPNAISCPPDRAPNRRSNWPKARRAVLAARATPVAIGSGVINDLVKYAAFGLDRPYLCVATAASMDGYTSAGVAPVRARVQEDHPVPPGPRRAGRSGVIAAAPPEMTGWGYGDLAGKVPAGGDWIIADALGDRSDRRRRLADGAGRAGRLAGQSLRASPAGDRPRSKGLFTGLTLVGLAMELHGSSRPASGADHQIAHLWEMEDLMQNGERVSHGACVAVGCATTLALYDWVLTQDLTRLDADASRGPGLDDKAAEIRAAFGPGEIADRALEETRHKHLAPAPHRARLARSARSGRPRARLRTR